MGAETLLLMERPGRTQQEGRAQNTPPPGRRPPLPSSLPPVPPVVHAASTATAQRLAWSTSPCGRAQRETPERAAGPLWVSAAHIL